MLCSVGRDIHVAKLAAARQTCHPVQCRLRSSLLKDHPQVVLAISCVPVLEHGKALSQVGAAITV